MTKNKKFLIITLIVLALSVCLGVFRTYLLIKFVEPDTGFYVVNTSLGQVFKLLCIAFCIVAFGASLTFRKINKPENLSSKSMFVVFSSSLCAFIFVTVFALGLYNMTKIRGDVFVQASIFLCVPCAINFFNICAKEQRVKNLPQTVMAMFPPIFYAVRIIGTFIDKTTQINSSGRSLKLVALSAIMLMLLYEAEFMLKKEDQGKRSIVKYYVMCLFSFSFAIISVIPNICVCAFWVYNSDFLLMDILDACVGVYAFARALCLPKEL